jgi:hypothetical protein
MTDSHAPIQPSPGGATAAAGPPDVLRGALVAAIGRRRRRLRFRAAIAAATCAAVAAAVLGGGVLTSGPEPVLAIEDGNEWVTVRILDGEAGAAEMTQELQDAGIDAQVQALPATPDYVGRWMGIALGREIPRPCNLPEDAPDDTECANPPLLAGGDVRFGEDAFRIRRDAIYLLGETRSVLYLGRAPEPGEQAVADPPRGAELGFLYPAMDVSGQGGSADPAEEHQVK